jgi:hypothetical protein
VVWKLTQAAWLVCVCVCVCIYIYTYIYIYIYIGARGWRGVEADSSCVAEHARGHAGTLALLVKHKSTKSIRQHTPAYAMQVLLLYEYKSTKKLRKLTEAAWLDMLAGLSTGTQSVLNLLALLVPKYKN